MVGPIMLLKILHYKRLLKRRKNSNTNEEKNVQISSFGESSQTSKHDTYDETQQVCRVCLKEGAIPIHGNYTTDNVSEALANFAGIEIRPDDAYPKYLCKSCYALLQGAILLRKTAQQSDQALRQSKDIIIMTDNDEEILHSEEDETFDYEEKTKKSYHCTKCNLEFESFKDYDEHKLSPEHENMRHKCPVCNNTYTSLYFKKHLALHKLESSYMCDICGKKFVIQGQFTRHRLTHFYNLPFKCSLCPYRGRFTESLKLHMRTHTGEKPYQCTQCPSRFVNKSNLNKHMLTHKGEHDFKCESCGRGFYTKRNLDLHFKVDHTGIKDHLCNICGKAFGYRKQMMKHQLKVHKREKMRSGRMPLYLQLESKKQKGEDV